MGGRSVGLAALSDQGARLSGVRSRRLRRLYIICTYIYACFVLDCVHIFRYLQLQYLQQFIQYNTHTHTHTHTWPTADGAVSHLALTVPPA